MTFTAQASEGAVFIVQVPRSVLDSLLQVNPEAAMLLAVLDARSKTVDALPPTRGDGGSDRAMTAQSVLMFLEGEQDEQRARLASSGLPPSAAHSQVTWELTNFKASAELRISHRFLTSRDEVVAQPYRDLIVALRWIPTSGTMGYWLAKSWKERS